MKEHIPRIIKKHRNTSPTAIDPLSGGERTDVFRVRTENEDVCLKFHPVDENRSVLGMEFKLMEEFNKLGVKVPKPMFLDNISVSKEREYEYLIMSYEQGRLLAEEWGSLDKRERREISVRLLQILDTIKDVKVSGFGPLNQNLDGRCSTFSSYMKSEVEKFENSEVIGKVNKDVFNRAKRKLLKFSLFPRKPKYVHADFRLRNFIKKEKNLVLFDFANSMSMDPTFDFVRFLLTDFSKEAKLTKDGQFLEQTYLSDYYTGDDFMSDKSIYLLLLSFRLTPWFYSMKKTKHLESYLNLMSKLSS